MAAFGAGIMSSAALAGSPAAAQQTVPMLDTEDAELSSTSVGLGRTHPFLSMDARNGDYARGSYDDDASNLQRVPLHALLGLAIDLHHDAQGSADAFLLIESNNGFHGPGRGETSSPRSWYESNNLVGLAVRPADGLTLALGYTNKRSPNGVSGISHETSFAVAYEGRSAIGWLKPTFTLTARPAAGRGAYAQVGVEPEWKLEQGEMAAKFSIPMHLGVGWGGFYQTGTGTVSYGNLGLALSKPFRVGGKRLTIRLEILALVRDPTLRALDGDSADHAAVVPLATIGLSTAF